MKVEGEGIPLVEIKSKKNQNEGKGQPDRSTEKHKEPKMWKALVRAFGFTFLMGSLLKFVHDSLLFVSPYILG